MTHMSLAYAVFFECPRCGKQIDIGESTEALTRESVLALATRPGRQKLEGVCPECHAEVSVSVETLRSRVRN